MKSIFAAIKAVLNSIKMVLKPVFRAGKWTVETVAEVASPLVSVADQAFQVAEGAIEWAVGMPFRVVGGMFSGAAGGGGQNAEAAAAQAQQAVQAKASEADKAALLLQEAALVQRAAAFKARGQEWTDAFADTLPRAHALWISRLSKKECEVLAKCDTRQVAAVVARKAGIPGIRSPWDFEVLANQQQHQIPVGQPVKAFTEAEQSVLNAVAERIRARKPDEAAFTPVYASR